MAGKTKILCIIGPTASGKSSRAVSEALQRNGEVVSVDSRQVYRGLDIGTEKITREEMRGVPHHLIDIREPADRYSAGDFVTDARRLIKEITERGALPILAGGSHFYFDALLHGLPEVVPPAILPYMEGRDRTNEELYTEILTRDPRRAKELDPRNRRRLIRALEIIEALGHVPPRALPTVSFSPRFNLVNKVEPWKKRTQTDTHDVDWITLDVPPEELKKRLETRLRDALSRGLIDEVRRVRELLAKTGGGSPDASETDASRGDDRLNELGLEYRVVGEYLRGEIAEERLLPTLLSKLNQYARRQRAWIRKLLRD